MNARTKVTVFEVEHYEPPGHMHTAQIGSVSV